MPEVFIPTDQGSAYAESPPQRHRTFRRPAFTATLFGVALLTGACAGEASQPESITTSVAAAPSESDTTAVQTGGKMVEIDALIGGTSTDDIIATRKVVADAVFDIALATHDIFTATNGGLSCKVTDTRRGPFDDRSEMDKYGRRIYPSFFDCGTLISTPENEAKPADVELDLETYYGLLDYRIFLGGEKDIKHLSMMWYDRIIPRDPTNGARQLALITKTMIDLKKRGSITALGDFAYNGYTMSSTEDNHLPISGPAKGPSSKFIYPPLYDTQDAVVDEKFKTAHQVYVTSFLMELKSLETSLRSNPFANRSFKVYNF